MSASQFIVDASKPLAAYSERLLKDVGPHNYSRKPTWGLGGEMIDCNHPAFVFGHLALYPERVIQMCGHDGSKAAAPAGFADLFEDKKPCLDDPHGTIYPSLETITSAYFSSMDLARQAVARLSEADLAKPNPSPNEGARRTFPTVGALANFLLGAHVAIHLGQVSTWRRAMGLPSAN